MFIFSCVNTQQKNMKHHIFQSCRCCRLFLMNDLSWIHCRRVITQPLQRYSYFTLVDHCRVPMHIYVSKHMLRINSWHQKDSLSADRRLTTRYQTDDIPFFLWWYHIRFDINRIQHHIIYHKIWEVSTGWTGSPFYGLPLRRPQNPHFHDFTGSTRIVDLLINCRLPDSISWLFGWDLSPSNFESFFKFSLAIVQVGKKACLFRLPLIFKFSFDKKKILPTGRHEGRW